MHDSWEGRLSEYLDGELESADLRALEAHLVGCSECRAALDELGAVAARAAALYDRPPQRDLWDGIARRIGAGRKTAADIVDIADRRTVSRRRISLSLPQLAAAAIALVMLSAGTTWLLRPHGSRRDLQPVASASQTAAARAVLAGFDMGEYDEAVADLEQVLEQSRDRLDPSTVQVIERSLDTIDRAILEAQEALERDPTNSYLTSHLAATMRRKVELLQRAAAIVRPAS